MTSDIRHVKAARKARPCTWCWEMIEIGDPAVTWFTYGENVTADLHPECFAAHRAQMVQMPWVEDMPTPGTYRRGCYCEEKVCECETRALLYERLCLETDAAYSAYTAKKEERDAAFLGIGDPT